MRIALSAILFFLVSCSNFSPQEPVEVKAPNVVESSTVDKYPYLVVEIRSDHSVWYKAVKKESDTGLIKIDSPVTETLKDKIAAYKKEMGETKTEYLIRTSTSYAEFKAILEAFKMNEIYKFKMITLDEEKQH